MKTTKLILILVLSLFGLLIAKTLWKFSFILDDYNYHIKRLNDASNNFIVANSDLHIPNEEKDVAFVHIDNTIFVDIPKTLNWTYYDTRKPDVKKHTSFIVPLRNPIDIFIHMLLNEKRHKFSKILEFFGGSINQLATIGFQQEDISTDEPDTNACQKVSKIWTRRMLYGRDYEFYTKELLQYREKEVYVLRPEYLSYDWHNIKTVFQSEYNIIRDFDRQSKPLDKTILDSISENGLKNICRLICKEVQIFTQLLNRAANLNDIEKKKSLQDLSRFCPIEIIENGCISNPPSFSNEVVDVGNRTLLDISRKTRQIAFIHIGKICRCFIRMIKIFICLQFSMKKMSSTETPDKKKSSYSMSVNITTVAIFCRQSRWVNCRFHASTKMY